MTNNYEQYLELINQLLQKYFEAQKDYIHCKPGCSHCCESGEYPYSETEFEYLMLGYNTLSEQEKAVVQGKIERIKKDKIENKDKEFLHECPFLIDKKCSVYNHRGIICRTHGLLFFIVDEHGNSKNKIPNCAYLGLNYSNVFDKTLKIISLEMWEATGIEKEPVAYNIGLKALLRNDLVKEYGLEFKEIRALIDWF